MSDSLPYSAQAALQSSLPAPLYTLAETLAAAATPEARAAVATVKKSGGGLLAPLTDALEVGLRFFQTGLDTLHVPYSYGFSIILLTLSVKLITFPLTKQQVESALAVQSLKPRIELIKARYGEDKDKVSKETSLLYEQAGVNPLAGCLPTLATIPIFIGLYSSLTNVANAGDLENQGFFWIPSLAGPVSMAQRGTDWLLPLVDGAPPVGWDEGLRYLSLPVLLVIMQTISSKTISTPIDESDPNSGTFKALNTFLPFMVGYFALCVPSGLGLYYLSNTVLTLGVQIYLRKLGGAKINVKDLGPVTKPGSGRRTGPEAVEFLMWESQVAADLEAAKAAELAALSDDGSEQPSEVTSLAAATPGTSAESALGLTGNGNDTEQASGNGASSVSWVVKRKKLELVMRA